MNTAESLPKWNRPGRDLARTPGKCVLNAYLDERSSADALSAGSRGRRGAGAQQERRRRRRVAEKIAREAAVGRELGPAEASWPSPELQEVRVENQLQLAR
jgi:hypothetical protein